MRKLLNNPFAVAGLVALAMLLIFWPQIEEAVATRRRPQSAATSSVAGESATGLDTATAGPQALFQRIRQVFETYSFPESGRNPFRFHEEKPAESATGPEQPPAETQSVRLAAVWIQDGARLAFLNRRIAVLGDRIGFVEVGEVSADGVWLIHRGTRTFLRLGEQHTFEQSTEPPEPALP